MRKFISTTLILLCVLLLGLFGIAVLAVQQGDYFLSQYVKRKTDYRVEVTNYSASILDSKIHMRGVGIMNPTPFPAGSSLALIKNFKVDLDFASLFVTPDKPLIIEEIVLNIDTLGFVTDKNGNNNAITFAKAFTKKPDSGKEDPSVEDAGNDQPSEKYEKKPFTFLIRKLTLSLDKIHLLDESRSKVRDKTFDVGLTLELENISSFQSIVDEVKKKIDSLDPRILLENFLRGLIDPRSYLNLGDKALDTSQDLLKQGVKGAGSLIKNALNSLKQE